MKKLVLSLVLVMAGSAAVLASDSLEKVKERRRARRTQVNTIVKDGGASEGSNGFLVAGKDLAADKKKVVEAENSDRKIGYAAIAKSNGKSVEEVGRMAGQALQKARGGKK